MPTNIVSSAEVTDLLDRASGANVDAGNPRVKAITRDILQALMQIIEKHDINEGEFWQAVHFMQGAGPEFGLIAPGVGLEHFLDLHMDAQDEAAGIAGGTPRTIEGPLFVEGAPLSQGQADMQDDPDEGEALKVWGIVSDINGNPIEGAIVDVWHATSSGAYSHFDPSQSPFNNRRKIQVGADGKYVANTLVPVGYSCPPGGFAERLMQTLGRHADRPAHVHLLARADGYRPLTTQINIADDPKCHDDFAFGTRDGLVPSIDRSQGDAQIRFDLKMVAGTNGDTELSSRPRAAA